MKPRTDKCMELYHIMLKRGYPEAFCDQVTKNLNTDWTAQRIMRKKHLENANASWNEYLLDGGNLS